MKKSFLLTCLSCLLIACQEYEPFTKSDMYTRQFEQYIGGEIHPEQTWGFHNIYTAQTRSIGFAEGVDDPFTFYETEDYYKNQEDLQGIDGLVTIKNYGEANNLFEVGYLYIDNKYLEFAGDGKLKLHLWQGEREIYISGNVAVTVDGTNQAKFYVLPGATLTLDGVEGNDGYINNMEIYVSPDATLIYKLDKIDGGNDYNSGNGKIFNAGTFICDAETFSVSNNNAIFYNEGDATVNNLTANGNPSFIYNYLKLTVKGDLYLDNAGAFFNGDIINVTGDTKFTNDFVWWVNEGHYYTTNMSFSANHGYAYNFCQLLVEETFEFHDGVFNLMAGSYIEANNADFRNFAVHMWGHSGINIKYGAVFHMNADGNTQGFIGDEWSYIRLGGKTETRDNSNCLTIHGKVVYGINNLDDQSEDNEGNEACYFDPESKRVPFESITAEESTEECDVQWTPNLPDEEPSEVTVRVIVEDLPATISSLIVRESDFDYNDAVFDVTFREEEIEITVHACGGTLPLYVADREVHGLFYLPTTTPMINKNDAEREPQTFTIARNGITDANDIPVWVEYEGKRYDITAFRGDAPAKICVGTDYVWCDEGWDIKKEYPKFTEWAQSNNYTDNSWYRDNE